MNKSRINKLIPLVNKVLNETKDTKEGLVQGGKIDSSYDGQVAGFGVSIAISKLRPTLAMYYNSSQNRAVDTTKILAVIAKTISKDGTYCQNLESAKSLMDHAFKSDVDIKKLTEVVIECAVALKLVVRTYPQTKND